MARRLARAGPPPRLRRRRPHPSLSKVADGVRRQHVPPPSSENNYPPGALVGSAHGGVE
eukprot:CAMPEP_0185690884 /NCGR_PEP_ID=MMETSP1164-20130828/1425_1 /TAXON_ID=1104430 /ORGANISM="Chrysoreinhardia sp, Strain CCMP2950" /LENGTH=58 /DNA_ID=CAMNT_0028357493 /DNA_START=53 /DNA_END=226 /DNA_ORIENTATION=-